ncbi:MAG: hypothetical protein ACJ8AW_20135 [Rhodopila sp.]
MLIGYARVSTHDQTLALQQDALTYGFLQVADQWANAGPLCLSHS